MTDFASSLITGGGIINYNIMCLTYIFFWRAVKAQGVDRKTFAYTGWFQPYSVSRNNSQISSFQREDEVQNSRN